MEKINSKIKKVKDYEHLFYCDECGEYLGTSAEYDDGWYERLGEVKFSVYIDGDWYKVNKCLCDDCADKFFSNLKTHLKSIGFEKE